jgi:hypothetical protein
MILIKNGGEYGIGSNPTHAKSVKGRAGHGTESCQARYFTATHFPGAPLVSSPTSPDHRMIACAASRKQDPGPNAIHPTRLTLGPSHTKLVVSEWYERVSLPIRSMECSRCLREVLYTYILGFLTNNGMPPTNIFDILVRSALTAHMHRGSDNAFSTRLSGKYCVEEHTFFQA